jgi:hypothetical protein
MRILLAAIVIFLSGCASEPQQFITKQKQLVVLPDEKMYRCPTIALFPNSQTLTDIQVAKLLIQLHTNNLECKNSLTAVKAFLEKAKTTAEANEELD